MKAIKRNSMMFLGMALLIMMVVKVNAAGSVAVNLTTSQKSAQSGYGVFEATKMYCEVTSASKYPIKFEAYGKNSAGQVATLEKSIVYNVNAKGTVAVKSSKNMHSIKLTGWNVGSEVKKCIGWGKIY